MAQERDSFTDPVREERIALLEHHASQMQAYKIYAFSLLAGFFAVVQSLSALGWRDWLSTTVVWFVVGIVAGGLFFCLGRFMWYGAMVSKTISTSFKVDQSSAESTLMGQLEFQIGQSALAGAQAKTEKKLKRIARWLIRLGQDRLGLLCWSVGILDIVMVIRLMVTVISLIWPPASPGVSQVLIF